MRLQEGVALIFLSRSHALLMSSWGCFLRVARALVTHLLRFDLSPFQLALSKFWCASWWPGECVVHLHECIPTRPTSQSGRRYLSTFSGDGLSLFPCNSSSHSSLTRFFLFNSV
ncbi:hypothetical protein C8J57DRAFT_476181 [Mycena rebaudengoi]|nr:hypothetical protein C8J57DRAFT_476181 [Mycena rebaudengoi]